MNVQDAIEQAQWEINLENFEQLVVKQKKILREKKVAFPWRLKLINLNKEK